MKFLKTKKVLDGISLQKLIRGSVHGILGLTITFMSAQAMAGIAVVVSSGSDVSELNQKQAKAIFLGKKSKSPGGISVDMIYQAEGADTYSIFNKAVLRKTDAKMSSYWAARVFSGKGTPPDSVDSDQAVIDHVNSVSGGIGYVDSGSVDGTVKVLFSSE